MLFLILSAILLMVMEKKWPPFADIRAKLSLPLAPIHYIADMPVHFVETLGINLRTQHRLLKENKRLKKSELVLRSQLQRLLAIEAENVYLKELLQSAKKVKGKTLIAELLAVASEPYMNQLILNKGKNEGVYEGQPVLDANGVVGQVMEVGPITSRVLLINDPHSGIAVQNARNGVRATASGDHYSGKIRLMYLPKTVDVEVGDIFITSGLGGRYPEGYPVGTVVSLNKDPANQFASVLIEPSARLNSSRQVLLVWYQ